MDGRNMELAEPWSVQNVPRAIARAAVGASRRKTGQWISAAIDAYLATGRKPSRFSPETIAASEKWTIKKVRMNARNALTDAAKKSDWAMAEWLAAAVEYYLLIQAREVTLPALIDGHGPDRVMTMLSMCDEMLRAASALRDICRDEVVLRRQIQQDR